MKVTTWIGKALLLPFKGLLQGLCWTGAFVSLFLVGCLRMWLALLRDLQKSAATFFFLAATMAFAAGVIWWVDEQKRLDRALQISIIEAQLQRDAYKIQIMEESFRNGLQFFGNVALMLSAEWVQAWESYLDGTSELKKLRRGK